MSNVHNRSPRAFTPVNLPPLAKSADPEQGGKTPPPVFPPEENAHHRSSSPHRPEGGKSNFFTRILNNTAPSGTNNVYVVRDSSSIWTLNLPDEPDQAFLDQLRRDSPTLSKDDVQVIAKAALTERSTGNFYDACLLGPLLSGRSEQEAEDIARKLDNTTTKYPGSSTRETANKIMRGFLLIQTLCEIGNPDNPDVYKPLIGRLKSEATYKIFGLEMSQGQDVRRLRKYIPEMGESIRNDICTALLERQGDEIEDKLDIASQIYPVQRYLSEEVRRALLTKMTMLVDQLKKNKPPQQNSWVNFGSGKAPSVWYKAISQA